MKHKLLLSGIFGFGIGFIAGVIAHAVSDDIEDLDIFDNEDVSVCVCDEDCGKCKYRKDACEVDQMTADTEM